MPSFSFDQYNRQKDQPFTANRNVLQVRTHDALNNPNRPEFMSPGSTARDLFRHAFRTLIGQNGEANATAYWNNLLTMSTRAARDPAEERNLRDRRSGEVEIALAATDDMLSPDQLRGGMMASMARRELYADLPDTISRREKTAVIDYLTARALGEATGTVGDLREPRGTVGREATRLLADDTYKMLAAGVDAIYTATKPDPADEMNVDVDNLDDAGLAREAAVAESTRIRKTQNVIRSFADSYLREPIDQANTVSGGEQNLQNTMFVMETAQEAAVMEAVVSWAHKKALENGGRKPSVQEIKQDFVGPEGIRKELERYTTQTVTTKIAHSDAHIERLQMIINPNRALAARIEQADREEKNAASMIALEAWLKADPKNTDDNFEFNYVPDKAAVEARNAKFAEEAKKQAAEALTNPSTRALLIKAVEQQSKRFNGMTEEQRAQVEKRSLEDSRVVTPRDLGRVAAMLRATQEVDGKTVPKNLYRTAEMARVAQAFVSSLTQDRSPKAVAEKKTWVQIESRETTQRMPIFGDRASRFEFMRATLVDGATFYKNTDAVQMKVRELDAQNRALQDALRSGKPQMENGRPVYPGSILIGENMTKAGQSLPLQAVLEEANRSNMPVVRLAVTYNRSKQVEVHDNAENTIARDKSLTYTVTYSDLNREGKPETKTAELFSADRDEHLRAMKALSGAVVVVEGRAPNGKGGLDDRETLNESQGQMIRWQALTDMAKEAVIFGYGGKDYNSNQLIRMTAENDKLMQVYDAQGQEVEDHVSVYAKAAETANNKLETALKALDLKEPKRNRSGDVGDNYYVDRSAPLDGVYARLLVHNMRNGRSNEDVAAIAKVPGTVDDLFKVAEARADAGRSLDADTRANYQKLAKAIGADTFSVESIDNIRRVGQASSEARRAMARIEDKGLSIEFDGPGTKSGPVVSIGSRGRSFEDVAQTPNMMMVGGSGTPTEAQRKAIDDSVAAAAARGYGIVTVATKGANEAVIDAALKHNAKLTVVMADSPLVSEATGDVRRQLGEVVRSEKGLVVAKYDMLDVPGRENERERMAYGLAGDMSAAAVMVKGSANDRAVYEVAKFGQEKPVATLPAYSLQDTGNKLLTEAYGSAQSSRVIGSAISSSFYSSMTADGRWETKRENEPIVTAHQRVEISVEWHDPAAHMRTAGQVGDFVGRWADSVASGRERGMINPEIKTERDLAIAMGRESAPIDMAKYAGPDVDSEKEAAMHVALRAEIERAANTNRPEARKRAAGGMEM